MLNESPAESKPETELPPEPPAGSLPLRDPKREIFCHELVAGGDLYKAFTVAGFKRPRGNAQAMLAEDLVQARVRYLYARAAELAQIEGGRLLLECEKVAFSNIMDYVTIDKKTGMPKGVNLKNIRHAQGAAIQEISYDAKGRPKIKLYDKTSMLKHLQDRVAPVPQRHELTGKDGAPLVPGAMSDLELARSVLFMLDLVKPPPTESETATQGQST